MTIKTRSERIDELEESVAFLYKHLNDQADLINKQIDMHGQLSIALRNQVVAVDYLGNLLVPWISMLSAKAGMSPADIVQDLERIANDPATPSAASEVLSDFLNSFAPIVEANSEPGEEAQQRAPWLRGVFTDGKFVPVDRSTIGSD